MIEGLRLLPWLQERIRSDRDSVETLLDCSKCMASNDRTVRQTMGCGYEMPHPTLEAHPWQHSGYSDEAPTTCVGYTAKLPEVAEINRARMHAKNGMARDFLRGPASENLLRGIEILEASTSEASCWHPPKDPT